MDPVEQRFDTTIPALEYANTSDVYKLAFNAASGIIDKNHMTLIVPNVICVIFMLLDLCIFPHATTPERISTVRSFLLTVGSVLQTYKTWTLFPFFNVVCGGIVGEVSPTGCRCILQSSIFIAPLLTADCQCIAVLCKAFQSALSITVITKPEKSI